MGTITIHSRLTPVESSTPAHSLPISILLHFLPGLVTYPFVLLCYPLFTALNLPPSLIMLVIAPPVITLFHLGYLLGAAWKDHGSFSLRGIVLYRSPIPSWQYLVYVPVLLIVTLLIVALFSPLDGFLKENLFFWIPGWLSGEPDFAGNETYRMIGVFSYAIFGVIIGPVVQEMYFRGYLLPRLAWLKGWGILLNTFLFSMMHLTTPWQWLSAGFGFLPVTIMVARKQNISLAIAYHCLLNILSLAVLTGFLTVPG